MIKRKLRLALVRRLLLRDSWAICFVLGFMMMNFPFLSIFNKPTLVWGVPLLYLYLQLGWIVSIAIGYLFSGAQEHRRDDERRS